MKAIAKIYPEKSFSLIEKKIPQIISPKDVQIKMIYVGICGTDLHIYKYDDWAKKNIQLPHVNGHEGLAKVIAIGSEVTKFKIGDLVSFETHIFDETCYSCQNKNFNTCLNKKVLGVSVSGIWQEINVINEKYLVSLNEIKNIDLSVLSLVDAMGNAMHTLSYCNLKNKNVLIVGDGPIGLIASLIAKTKKPKNLFISGINPTRYEIAKKWNINYIDVNKNDLFEHIKKIIKDEGIDVICEFSGNKEALLDSLKLLNVHGMISILSIYPEEKIELPLNELTFKNVNLQFVFGRKIWKTWKEVIDFLKTNPKEVNQLKDLITHILDFKDFEKAFQKIESQKAGKILLKFS